MFGNTIWYNKEVTKRREVNQEAIQLIQDEKWLRYKIEVEGYSSSRLAKELGIYRASVERYRIKFGIEQKLSQKELLWIITMNT